MSALALCIYSDAIDLRHLDRQTLGDARLADELLGLFVAQAQRCLDRVQTDNPCDLGEAAHRLKGAARAVGAFAVGDAAEALEALLVRDGDTRLARDDLAMRIAEARRFFDALQARNQRV